jgi:septum formation protein
MLILASNSPRRKQLLSLGGWDFSVQAPKVDESVLPDEAPADYVRRIALNKARGVREALTREQRQETIILAADTAVVNVEEGAIFGKPASAQAAEAMLRQLRGRVHQVYTGLAALNASDGWTLSKVVVTDVPMRAYSDEEMRAYIATGDPMDKAGAYAIQHPGFHPVQNLQGCFANVMGLPVCHASRLLAEMGHFPVSEIAAECQQALDFPCQIFRQALQGQV